MNRTANAADVRAWARRRQIEVGSRGHIAQDLIDEYNRRNDRNQFENTNPALR
jgi:hypothetical protein